MLENTKRRRTIRSQSGDSFQDNTLKDLVRDLEEEISGENSSRQVAVIINRLTLRWLCSKRATENGVVPEIVKNILQVAGGEKGKHFLKIDDILSLEKIGENGAVSKTLLSRVWERLAERLETISHSPAGGNVLGDTYEAVMNRQVRKQQGQYYTPQSVIDQIFQVTLATVDVVEQPFVSLLDPACGSGHFLLAAYRILMDKFSNALPALRKRYQQEVYPCQGAVNRQLIGEEYWQRENLPYHVLTHCLHGAESDGLAGEIAATALLLQIPQVAASRINILTCDSLLKWERDDHWVRNGDEVHHRITGDSFLTAKYQAARDFWSKKFDYVLGNPPYISFGLNRVGRLSPERERYYREEYLHSAEYKINYYALFFERGIHCLAPGGYLGYVTPDSYLQGQYFSRLRRHILGQCQIQQIRLLTGSIFRGATVGRPTISIFKKNGPEPTSAPLLITAVKVSEAGAETFTYNSACFWRQPFYRFRLYFHPLDKKIIEKMEKKSGNNGQLGQLVRVRTGMRGRQGQGVLKGKEKRDDHWQPGLVSSAQIRPFYVDYRGDWLNVRAELLYKGGWDAAVMEQPKILVRQTGDSVIAAIDRNGFYHLNNLHSMNLRSDVKTSPVSLEFLVGILNSRLLNYYYHVISLEEGRAMAQTDIETLEKLPICYNLSTVAVLSAKVANLSDGSQSAEQVLTIRRQIDRLIYELYGLDAAEISRVEAKEAECNYYIEG